MLNKRFQNKSTSDVIQIKNDDGVWYTLNTGAKIKKESFFNKYTEILDPESFFSTGNNDIANIAKKIDKIDSSKVITENTNPVIKRIDDDYQQNPINIDKKQQMIDDYMKKQQEIKGKYPQIDDVDNSANRLLGKDSKKDDEDYYSKELYKAEVPPDLSQQPEEDVYKFFKNFKKVYPIEINLKFRDMIAEPEFLKLMSSNFDSDVIQFYTKEIFGRIIFDPKKVEEDIYKQIYEVVFGKKIGKKIFDLPLDKMIEKGKTKTGQFKYIFINNNNKDVILTTKTGISRGYKPKLKK